MADKQKAPRSGRPRGGELRPAMWGRTQAAVLLALAALLVAALVAWAMPRPLGDLYLALAGGRDVLEGKLGQPDDWSFTTEGRVWVNSSWGANLVFALVHRLGGQVGLLVLKAVTLLALGFLAARTARVRGASDAAAFMAAAFALAASPQDLILRPNLLSLLFVPGLLLFLLREPKTRLWLLGVTGLFIVWSNVHGAFIFGLLLLFLWAAVATAFRLVSRQDGQTRGPWWLPLVALLSCVGAGFFANPFGPRNVLLQITVPRSEVWRNVIEWGPLWDTHVPGVAFPILFVVMAVVALAGHVHRFLRRENITPERVFELLLVLVVIALAVLARRLVPWAAVALVPSVALALDAFVPERRRAALQPIPALGLIAFLVASNLWVARHYARNHPLFPNETLLERMVLFHTHFPGGAAQFLRDNHVKANAFSEWRWEGYLHHEVPDVKVMVGGRAHQIYDEATYTKYRKLLKGENPLSEMRNMEASLAIVPLTPEYGPLCRGLLRGEGPWAYVYSDRYTAVFADPNDPSTKDLVIGASEGRLAYPDTATAVLSRALCLSSPSVSPIMSNMPNLSVPLFREAVNRRPSGYAYMVMVSAALRARVPREQLIIYLEQEDARLEALARGAPEEHAILGSRLFIADQLERLYPPEATDKKERLTTLRDTVNKRMLEIGQAYPRYFRLES